MVGSMIVAMALTSLSLFWYFILTFFFFFSSDVGPSIDGLIIEHTCMMESRYGHGPKGFVGAYSKWVSTRLPMPFLFF